MHGTIWLSLGCMGLWRFPWVYMCFLGMHETNCFLLFFWRQKFLTFHWFSSNFIGFSSVFGRFTFYWHWLIFESFPGMHGTLRASLSFLGMHGILCVSLGCPGTHWILRVSVNFREFLWDACQWGSLASWSLYRFLWVSLSFRGFPWVSLGCMGLYVLPWNSLGFHGFFWIAWDFMVCNRCFCDFHWLS